MRYISGYPPDPEAACVDAQYVVTLKLMTSMFMTFSQHHVRSSGGVQIAPSLSLFNLLHLQQVLESLQAVDM